MKQIAFAALAAMAYGMRKPKLILSYDDTENYFLGLEHNNPVTMKLPGDKRAKDPANECTGWQLEAPGREFSTFRIEQQVTNKCTKLVFHTNEGLDAYDQEEVWFWNDCGNDIDGDRVFILNVQVYDDGMVADEP